MGEKGKGVLELAMKERVEGLYAFARIIGDTH